MKQREVTDYRDFLKKYAESTRLRKPGFTLGSWSRALGLKSTSSLTKVINGEREAGPELIAKLIRYFKFNELEEAQFRNLVALSKLKESSGLKNSLAESLLRSEKTKSLKRRMLELEQFELLDSYLPMAVRECTRLAKMSIAKLTTLFVDTPEIEITKAIHVLARLEMIKRDSSGHFVAIDDHLNTEHEIPSEALQTYHEKLLQLGQEKIKSVEVEDRELQSLVLLIDRTKLPELKKKIRDFMDTLETDSASEEVNQLYQLQLQMIPLTKKFENTANPNLNQEKK